MEIVEESFDQSKCSKAEVIGLLDKAYFYNFLPCTFKNYKYCDLP